MNFRQRFSKKKKSSLPNFMKIRPVGTEFFHADGRTGSQRDVTKLIEAFGYFASAPKTGFLYGVADRLVILIKYVSEAKGKNT